MQSCSKNKTVLICGDHICVNKTEAKQYFEGEDEKVCRSWQWKEMIVAA